jgi:hypothetical protein
MSYPDDPVLSYSYTGFQQAQGNNSFPGTRLDADLASIVAAIAQINDFFSNFVRSDGKLASGSVTKAALDASLLLGVGSPTNWATGAVYHDGDTVTVTASNKLYVAKTDHTAGASFAADLTAGKWLLLADFSTFTLADGVVLTSKLADLAVTAAKLADDAVTADKIADLAVVTAALADGAVTLAKLADGAIGAAKIANLAVETAKLADQAVSSAKLTDGAVTKVKMANVGGQRVIGNAAGVAGTPTDLSISQILDWLSSTQGAVLYRGSAGWQALAPGAAGQFLKSNGAGADPAFAAIGGSGMVTSIVAGTGLLGGTITSAGTISLETAAGGVGTYTTAPIGGNTAVGATVAGSALGGGRTGMWRCMGWGPQALVRNEDTGFYSQESGPFLWLRIS